MNVMLVCEGALTLSIGMEYDAFSPAAEEGENESDTPFA